jgi:hypothetical protein
MFDASWENLSQTKYFPSALKQLERHIALNIMNVVALGHLKHNGKKFGLMSVGANRKDRLVSLISAGERLFGALKLPYQYCGDEFGSDHAGHGQNRDSI